MNEFSVTSLICYEVARCIRDCDVTVSIFIVA